jgi:hypothetical protein
MPAAMPTLEPVLKKLENGRLVRSWVAIALRVIAILAVVGGLVAAYRVLKYLSQSGATGGGLLLGLVMVVAGAMMAQIVYYRAGAIARLPDSRFTVIPILSQMLRCAGEIYAAFATVFAIGGAVFVWITKQSPLDLIGSFSFVVPRAAGGTASVFVGGLLFLVYTLVAGFLALIFFYAAAEAILALVTIAQNTEKK